MVKMLVDRGRKCVTALRVLGLQLSQRTTRHKPQFADILGGGDMIADFMV
jgi:hypothetical protein